MSAIEGSSAAESLGTAGKNPPSGLYFIKAVALVLCLMVVAKVAPFLPSVLFPLVFAVYAVLSTIGALYFTVINRLYKQYKLTEEGDLSRLNRKWKWMMAGLLAASLASAFLFVLGSPKWDNYEWLLVWIAIPLYYVVYRAVGCRLEREYAPRFHKAYTMRWSFWIVGIVLCIAYAALSVQLMPVEYAGLSEAFQSTYMPYEHSMSAVMREADKLSSLADGITWYAISQVSMKFFLFAFVCKFVVFASVIFGVLNQLRLCFLNFQEIKSEFQILPAHGEAKSSGPLLRIYIVILVSVLAVATLLFLCVEFEAAKAQATNEYTAVDVFVDEQTENVIFFVEGKLEEAKELVGSKEDYDRQKQELIDQRNEELRPLIEEYYDQCVDNIGSYLDWYGSPFGAIAKHFKSLMRDDAVKTFKERVTDGSSAAEIEDRYNEYRNAVVALDNEMLAATLGDEAFEPIEASSRKSIDLWAILENPESLAVIDDYLLNTEEGTDEKRLEEKIKELIEMARETTLSFLEEN